MAIEDNLLAAWDFASGSGGTIADAVSGVTLSLVMAKGALGEVYTGLFCKTIPSDLSAAQIVGMVRAARRAADLRLVGRHLWRRRAGLRRRRRRGGAREAAPAQPVRLEQAPVRPPGRRAGGARRTDAAAMGGPQVLQRLRAAAGGRSCLRCRHPNVHRCSPARCALGYPLTNGAATVETIKVLLVGDHFKASMTQFKYNKPFFGVHGVGSFGVEEKKV
jgi:hypothetical protein